MPRRRQPPQTLASLIQEDVKLPYWKKPPDFDLVEVDKNRWVLRVKGPYGRKDQGKSVWCAKITGPHAVHRYERLFMGDRRQVEVSLTDSQRHALESWPEMHVVIDVDDLVKGDLLEMSSAKYRRGFYRVMYSFPESPDIAGSVDAGLEAITEEQLRQLLGLKISVAQDEPRERKFRIGDSTEKEGDGPCTE